MTSEHNTKNKTGTWVLTPTNEGYCLTTAILGGVKFITYLTEYSKNIPLSPADVRLIASAPELLAALNDARAMLKTARQYFPKSIRNSDTFRLLNVLANTIEPAIARAKKEEET
jgi:homoserine kinase